MKVPFYLISVVIFLALTTTLLTLMLIRSTPIGNQPPERIQYRQGLLDEEPHYHHKEHTTPSLIEYLGYAQALVNNSFYKPESAIQELEDKLLDKILANNATYTELPQETDTKISRTGSVPEDDVTTTPESPAAGLDEQTAGAVTVTENSVAVAETYASIHGKCSHCMDEFGNGTSIKYLSCMCAIFGKKYPTEADPPLTSKTFHNISCHRFVPSKQICRHVCISMAQSHNDLESDMICHYLPHAERIKVHLQSKLCEDGAKWMYTGVSSSNPICCRMHRTVPC